MGKHGIVIVVMAAVAVLAGCSGAGTNAPENKPLVVTVPTTPVPQQPAGTPPMFSANYALPDTSSGGPQQPEMGKFKPADIAKLKWLVGTWRGMDGGKALFFVHYRMEGTTLIADSFVDESMTTPADTTRFELTDGRYENPVGEASRSAAVEITNDHVQFLPISGDNESVRFEKQPNGKCKVLLDSVAPNGTHNKKTYMMEPFKK